MEVPVINRVGDLQLGIGRLPTLISQVLIEQVPEIFSFLNWKWGVVILAVYAIVNSLLVRFKIVLIRFRNRQSAVTKSLLSYTTDEDDDDGYTSDEEYSSDEDASVSSSPVNDDEYDQQEDEKVKDRNDAVFGSFFDFSLAGSSCFEKEKSQQESNALTRRFSWSNFAIGKCVVKLWDDDVIISARKDEDGELFLSLADTRLRPESIITSWKSSDVVKDPRAADGLPRVYLRDEVGEKVRVVDLRKATEWLDADGGDDVAEL